ncbi:MAG: ankyrin repeat domain-containing protein [Armatimonadia bacterium]
MKRRRLVVIIGLATVALAAVVLPRVRIKGDTLLHKAIERDHPSLALGLLYLGASPTAVDRNGGPPIHRLVQAQRPNRRVLSLLLRRGAPVDQRAWEDSTPLHTAAGSKTATACELLLEAGATVDAADCWKRTPLMIACRSGGSEVAELLLGAGASTNKADNDGKTPLILACEYSNLATIKALLAAGAKVKARDNSGKAALHYAAMSDSKEAVTIICDAGADLMVEDYEGTTPIWAARNAGKDANARLIDARCQASKSIFEAAREGDLRVLEQRLDEGVDPNAKDKHSRSPLSYAFLWQPEATALLVERGARRDDSIHMAAAAGDLTAVKRLIARGIGPNASLDLDGAEYHPLYLAARSGNLELVKYLVARGAKLEERSGGDCATDTALMAAIGNFPMVKWLVDHGADVNAASGCDGCVSMLSIALERKDERSLRYLIAHGANVNQALIAAASCRDLQTCRALVKLGADVNYKHKGQSPLSAAQDFDEIVTFLRRQGARR